MGASLFPNTRALLRYSAVLLTLALSACSAGNGSGPVLQNVEVTPNSPSIAAGTRQQFKAVAVFSNGNTEDVTDSVTWSSSDATVATISNTTSTYGLAKTLETGTTTITAAYPGGSGSATLTVTAAVISSLAVTPASTSIGASATQQFKATATFSDATTQDVTNSATWASSNVGVATISNASGSEGLAQAVAAGTTMITAAFSGQTASTTLTVSSTVITSIAITPAATTIGSGTTQQFTATATYADHTTQNVTSTATWSSSNVGVATISNASSSEGLAQAIASGTTTISATLNGQTGSTTLTVSSAIVTSLAITPATPSIANGMTQQFTATATFSNSNTQDVTQSAVWSSSNTAVATISNAGSPGLAQTLVVGSTTISASFGNQAATASLTVTAAVATSVSVTPANPTIANGTTQQFTATATFSDHTVQNVTQTATWASAASTVATISNNAGSIGFAQSVGPGSTAITATFDSLTGSATLTVSSAAATSVAVTPTNASIAKGLSQQFAATATFNDGSTQDVTGSASWGSSNTNVATISNAAGTNGLAAAAGVGTAAISAAYSGASGSSALTVTSATLKAIQLTPANSAVPAGFSRQLQATGLYSDSSKSDVTSQASWQSSNANIAVVSNAQGAAGVASGIAAGSTNITAQLGTMSGSTGLTVTGATLGSVQAAPFLTSIPVGATQQYNATGMFSDNTTLDLTTQVDWQSSNTVAAPISDASGSYGLATGVDAGGPYTISAQVSSLSGAASLTVSSASLLSISIGGAQSGASVPINESLQFSATGTYSDGTTRDITTTVTWQSSNTGVATISNASGSNGLLQSVASGTTNVSASTGSIGSSTVAVVVNTASLQSISIAPSAPTAPPGVRQQFTATGTYSDGTQRDLTSEAIWTSSNGSAASIANASGTSGLATTYTSGTSTIAATEGAITSTATFTITSATLTSITLTPASANVVAGSSQQFTATGTYSDSSTFDVTSQVTWSSSAPTVSNVSNVPGSNGLTTAITQGTSTITVIDPQSSVTTSATLVVTNGP